MITINESPVSRLEDHLDLVEAAVREVGRVLPSFIDRDDLRSAATLALVKAFRANPEIDRALLYVRVRGSVRDELRSADFMSRQDRSDFKTVTKVKAELTSELGRHVLIPEIAAKTGLTGVRVGALLELGEDQDAFVDFDSIPADGKDPAAENQETDLAADLSRILDELPSRQASVLRLCYLQDHSLTEAAHILGISVERVSQLRTAGCRRIREISQAADLWAQVCETLR